MSLSSEGGWVLRSLVDATVVSLLTLLVGCAAALHKREASMPPDPGEILPEWAFDAPYYFRPPPDAVPRPVNQPDADHPARYYVNQRVFLIERPVNDVPADRVPRIAIWWTNTDGCVWTRAGFFGLGQTHFPFVAGDDGDYGIRFVGPGLRESLAQDTPPHRIYHLDTCPPSVTVDIEPDQPAYEPGQQVTISWRAEDVNLEQRPVQLAVCWSWENPDLLEFLRTGEAERQTGRPETSVGRYWQPIEGVYWPSGCLDYTIPAFAAGEGLQLQVRAKDRAGNYGAGYSKIILVNGYRSLPASSQPADSVAVLLAPTTEPAP